MCLTTKFIQQFLKLFVYSFITFSKMCNVVNFDFQVEIISPKSLETWKFIVIFIDSRWKDNLNESINKITYFLHLRYCIIENCLADTAAFSNWHCKSEFFKSSNFFCEYEKKRLQFYGLFTLFSIFKWKIYSS